MPANGSGAGIGSAPRAYTSRTALLTKRSAVRSTNHLVTKRPGWCGEVWPRRSGESFSPEASPPRCAQLTGLALRGCLALVLGATAERRNLFFRSDLGLPWIRSSSLRLSRYYYHRAVPSGEPIRFKIYWCTD
jgi:hypothetical protein